MFSLPLSSNASHTPAIVSLHKIIYPFMYIPIWINIWNMKEYSKFSQGRTIQDMPGIFAPNAQRGKLLARYLDLGLGCSNYYTYIQKGLCVWKTGITEQYETSHRLIWTTFSSRFSRTAWGVRDAKEISIPRL